MTNGRRQLGHLLALLGSGALIVSLWEPWYSFRIPPELLNQAVQFSGQMGALGPVVRQAAQIASHLGPLHVTSWRVMTTVPVILLVVGVVAGGVSLAAVLDRAVGVARLVAGAGLIGAAAAFDRMIAPPGSSGLLHPAWGLYLALGSSVVVLVGGLVAVSGEAEPAPEMLAASMPGLATARWSE